MNLSDLFGGASRINSFNNVWSGSGSFAQTTISSAAGLVFHGFSFSSRYDGTDKQSLVVVKDGTVELYRISGGNGEDRDIVLSNPYSVTTNINITSTAITGGGALDARMLVYYSL